MTDDATLSDFGVDATADGNGSSAGENAGDERTADDRDRDAAPTERDDGRDRTALNPSLATYACGDYVCARCGTESDRVWRDGDEFVCPDCKEW
ncbi:DUF7573 domain-containing protein [Halopiger thermotolerans]